MNNVQPPQKKYLAGRGIDCGTGFLVQSISLENGDVETKSVRDSFLEVKPANKLIYNTMKKGLDRAKVNYFESDGSFWIIGEDSLVQSVERQTVTRRPMHKGVISPKEMKALPLFKSLLKELLGEPAVENERVVYSVPASPTDAPFDIEYHESVIESILASLGFKGTSINEAQAIVFSELAEDDYTGLAISCGSGMANVCISNLAETVTSFAISKGGDYIDFSAATSLGFDPYNPKGCDVTPSLVTYVKEQGVDILNPDPDEKVQIAIAAYYKTLIQYIIDNIIFEINKLESKPKFLKPIKVVVSGGTSLAGNFLTVFKEKFDEKKHELPFEVSEVVHAGSPLTAVAEGALLALLAEV
jgi:hypothetical protein